MEETGVTMTPEQARRVLAEAEATRQRACLDEINEILTRHNMVLTVQPQVILVARP